MIDPGINLVYYTEPKIKLLYLDNLVRKLNYENTLLVDFDTNLTNLKRNTIVGSEYSMFERTEVSLPYEITFQTLLDKITRYCDLNSLIVIDSLNGLIDYFGIPFHRIEYVEDKTKLEKNMLNNHDQLTNKHGGYKGFSLLKILFQNQFLNEMPIVLTSYISKRSLDNLIMEIVTWDYDGKGNDRNHFRRISNSVVCLGQITNDPGLGVTLIKGYKKKTDPMSPMEFFPQSTKIKIDISPNF